MYRLIIFSGSLVYQLFQIYKTNARIKKKMKLLHTIIEIMPLTPSQLLSKLKDNNQEQILSICKGTLSAA